MTTTASSALEIVISRTIDAPRTLVFEMWRDPKHFVHWWGPFDGVNPECEIDFRAGGKFRWVMRSPDGVNYPMTGVYKEIVEPSRIVYVGDLSGQPDSWRDMMNAARQAPKGTPIPDSIVTVTFDERDGKTDMKIVTLFDTAATREAFAQMGMVQGWGMSLDRFERHAANTLGNR
jgi:uncharacterized protein YndB with AHSA1/START domain